MVTTLNIRPCSQTHHVHLQINTKKLLFALICNAVQQNSVKSHPSVILLYVQPVEDLILVYMYMLAHAPSGSTVDCKCICRQLFMQVCITSLQCPHMIMLLHGKDLSTYMYLPSISWMCSYLLTKLVFRGYLMQLVNTTQFT